MYIVRLTMPTISNHNDSWTPSCMDVHVVYIFYYQYINFVPSIITNFECILDGEIPTIRYSVVILDEAHERTVHTDLLFGVVKAAQERRSREQMKRLRIVIMSATLEAEKFSQYFNDAKILYIEGRQFPVQVYYTIKPQTDYVHSAITTVIQLHEEQDDGDILVFLTGREEIESMQELLEQCRSMFPSDWKDITVCPLFAALPTGQQQMVFVKTPKGCRKVILSTNIAETSITIPGVKYVIDTGMVKARGYNPKIGLDILCVQPVSKAQVRKYRVVVEANVIGYSHAKVW